MWASGGGTYVINSGASIGGAGRLVLQSGNITIDGDVSVSNLGMTGGALSGSGNITATDSFVWTGGTMSGSGKTVIAGTATGTLLPTYDYLYLARTLENAGQTTLSTSPSGYVMLVGDFGGGGTISNLAGGTFTLDDSAGISDYGMNWGQVSTMNNAGTIRHTGAGTSTVSVPLHNSGSIDVQAGGLVFSGGGSFSGISTLTGDVGLGGGAYTIVNGTSIGGDGTTRATEREYRY